MKKNKDNKSKKERALWEALEKACNLLEYDGGHEKTVEKLRKILVDNV